MLLHFVPSFCIFLLLIAVEAIEYQNVVFDLKDAITSLGSYDRMFLSQSKLECGKECLLDSDCHTWAFDEENKRCFLAVSCLILFLIMRVYFLS